MHGRGTYRYPNGDSYEGEYGEGKRHGRGTFRWPDGRSKRLEYADGVLCQ